MDKLVSWKSTNWSAGLYSFAILLISISNLASPSLPGKQSSNWSPPETIPGFDLDSWPPILVADESGVVHAFSSQWIRTEEGSSFRAIVYNQWSINNGWTEPVDILLSPIKEARLTDVFLDEEGVIHLSFWGGDNTAANIYVTSANSWEAGNASAWTYPLQVASAAGDPEGAVFVEDVQGSLFLIYHGKIYGNGIYLIKSQDGGYTWSSPDQIFASNSSAPLVWNIQAMKSPSGWINLVWNVITTGGQGRGIYYTRTMDGNEWSEPILLNYAREGYGTQTPAIVEHEGRLIVFFAGISMRESFDNGESWSDAGSIFYRHTGVNGSLAPVTDGSGVLHLFFGQRITGSPDIHGMWHSTFINHHWTEPEAIVKGPSVNDPLGDNSFDPYEARAVVILGNTLLVTWRMDPGLRGNGVWYSYKVLDVPKAPVIPLSPTNPPEPSSTAIGTDDINQTATFMTTTPADDIAPVFDKTRNTIYNFGSLIFWGVIPAIILIVILIISRFHDFRSP